MSIFIMILRKPLKTEFEEYKRLEIEFYRHHEPYNTMLDYVIPSKRNLKREFLNLLKDKDSFFCFVKLDGKVAGYIYGIIKKVETNEKGWKKIGSLNSIIVSKEFRKMGVAEHMVNSFFKWLKSKNIKYVEASCNVNNTAIINFNKKLGFQEQHIKFGKLI